jgi:hypothetical protein
MSELQALDAIREYRRLKDATLPGPFKWGGTDKSPGAYAAACAKKTVKHGDVQPQTWTVWQAESEVEPDGLTVSITGNGPHSEAFAALIAHLLTNLDWLLDMAVTGALSAGETPE